MLRSDRPYGEKNETHAWCEALGIVLLGPSANDNRRAGWSELEHN